MVVDNIRTAHSREAFQGPREILVAMGDAVRLQTPTSAERPARSESSIEVEETAR
jgi:hypothetical protein